METSDGKFYFKKGDDWSFPVALLLIGGAGSTVSFIFPLPMWAKFVLGIISVFFLLAAFFSILGEIRGRAFLQRAERDNKDVVVWNSWYRGTIKTARMGWDVIKFPRGQWVACLDSKEGKIAIQEWIARSRVQVWGWEQEKKRLEKKIEELEAVIRLYEN